MYMYIYIHNNKYIIILPIQYIRLQQAHLTGSCEHRTLLACAKFKYEPWDNAHRLRHQSDCLGAMSTILATMLLAPVIVSQSAPECSYQMNSIRRLELTP